MLDIALYELNLLTKLDKPTLILRAKKLGLSTQQMKDFVVANNKLPTGKHVQAILQATQKKITQIKK